MAEPGKFLSGNLMQHVSVMSFTASVGLMAMFAVDFVDMVFIGMLGNEALAAAVGYAGTVLFFTNSVNIGLSIAAGSLAARAIGAGEQDKAQSYATSVAALGLVVGLIVPLLILATLPQVLGFLGAEGEVARLAARYLTIILPTMPVVALAMTGMAILRAYGDARRSMMATLIGGCVNAVLDPLFIFGLGLGLDGAALATVVARFAMLLMAIRPALRVHQAFARPQLGRIRQDLGAVSGIASPAVLTNVATPVGTAIVTREMAAYGTEAVAGMAVIGRLMPMAFAVVLALSGAIGPIIGQNFGARQFDRVRGAINSGVLFSGLYVLAATVVLFFLREPIAALFQAEGLTKQLIFLFCGPLALASFFNAMIYVGNASFNNLGHPIYSTWINWGRHTLGTWPFAVLGAHLGGAAGILIGQAIGGVIFAALSYALVMRVAAQLTETRPVDPFQSQGRLHGLFGRHH
ncbi:MAG: MATE family efflux transporter [Pseudomonadota bacterium]